MKTSVKELQLKNFKMKNTFFITIGLMSTLAFCAPTHAQTINRENHPRRKEVNSRLARQNRRIHREVKSGEMTHSEAKRLHHEDKIIHREEKAMVHQNHGHLTKAEKKSLNQQENAVSKQIGH